MKIINLPHETWAINLNLNGKSNRFALGKCSFCIQLSADCLIYAVRWLQMCTHRAIVQMMTIQSERVSHESNAEQLAIAFVDTLDKSEQFSICTVIFFIEIKKISAIHMVDWNRVLRLNDHYGNQKNVLCMFSFYFVSCRQQNVEYLPTPKMRVRVVRPPERIFLSQFHTQDTLITPEHILCAFSA